MSTIPSRAALMSLNPVSSETFENQVLSTHDKGLDKKKKNKIKLAINSNLEFITKTPEKKMKINFSQIMKKKKRNENFVDFFLKFKHEKSC
jgi:hypothetical protein